MAAVLRTTRETGRSTFCRRNLWLMGWLLCCSRLVTGTLISTNNATATEDPPRLPKSRRRPTPSYPTVTPRPSSTAAPTAHTTPPSSTAAAPPTSATVPTTAAPMIKLAFPTSAAPAARPTTPTTAAPPATAALPTVAAPPLSATPPTTTALTAAPFINTAVAVPTHAIPPTTAAPSMPPLPITKEAPIQVESLIPYDIALTNGMVEINKVGFAKEYRFNLVAAMNTVAVRVAKIVSSGSNALNTSGQQRLLLRSSRVLVLSAYALPSTLKSVNNTSCPIVQNLPVTTDTSTLCQKVTAQIRFNITKGANQNDTARLHSMFVSDLIQSISNGELQTELDALLWSSGSDPVTVLTGRQTKPAVEANTNNGGSSGIQANESSTSLSPGAITGISLAATLLILPLVYLLLTRRKPYDDGKAKNTEQVEYRPDAADDDLQNRSQADSSTLGTDAAHFGGNGVVGGATTLGAAQACYGFGSGGGGGKNESGKTLNDEDEYEDDDYDNGSRTHMEWRSSAGISSLTMRSTGVGLASALSRDKKDDDPASDTDDGQSLVPSASRDRLDLLIESGDWAAVGTTAALLAAASDSQSETSLGRTGHSRGDSSRDIHSVNAEQAAYLDQLVEVGDWEGVVTAAAKFEAQTGLSDSPNGGGDSALQQRSTTARSVEASGGANSNGRSNEALGRHVIPQEIDTVNTPLNPLDGQESQY